jgi:transcriptional regulator with XRE-family HTH domain
MPRPAAQRAPTALGQALKLYRKRHRLTQEDLGALLEEDPRTVRRWENAEVPLTDIHALRRIADRLGIPYRHLGLAPALEASLSPEEIAATVARIWALTDEDRVHEAQAVGENLVAAATQRRPAGDAATLRAYARLYQAVAYVTSMRVRSEQADEPLYFYRQMEHFARALGDDGLLNVALTYQGDMYRRKGDLAKAIACLEAARDETPGADDAARGNALQLLGRAYVLAGNKMPEAVTALQAAEDLALQIGEQNTSTGRQFHLPHVYEEFAKTYDAMGQPQQALDYVDRAERAEPLTTATGMLLKVARGEILVHSGDLRNGVPLVAAAAVESRAQGNERRLERILTIQRFINRQLRAYGRAELALSEALEGDLSER